MKQEKNIAAVGCCFTAAENSAHDDATAFVSFITFLAFGLCFSLALACLG